MNFQTKKLIEKMGEKINKQTKSKWTNTEGQKSHKIKMKQTEKENDLK